MSTKTHWGRNETVLWPPQLPIYTVCTAVLVLPILMMLLVGMYLNKPFLARNYTGDYIKSSAGALFKMHNSFRLILLTGGKRPARVALPGDFIPGETLMPNGKTVGVTLAPEAQAQGYTGFTRGPERKVADEPLSAWFQAAIFGGDDLLGAYGPALIETGIVTIFLLCFAFPWDFKRTKRMKYGRLLRGPVMLTPKEFNATLKGQGIGIRTEEKGAILRIPQTEEAKHIQIMGDTGAGKSTLLKQILQQISDRGEVAIVYDPAGEFTQNFFKKKRGDWILNPLDLRCPYWTPASELRNQAEARTIAASLYQSTEEKKGEFFTQTPQKIFAHLLKYRPSPEQLVEWMANEDEIDRRVAGTELASIIAKGAQQQRSGVLASLGLVADSLRLLPTKEQANNREWSATEWAEKRKGWIFLTSTEAEQEALRPLHSLWIDLLILRLLTIPKPGQKRAWLVIDELASLQRLPQFHTALTKGRKSNNPIVYGYQGKAQLEVIYGHYAEVMLSQPATKFVMKTSEPKAAKWASELLGEIEIERARETVADGRRAGKSFTLDRQIEPLVMSSEIEGLADLHTFVKLGNYVSRFAFPHISMKIIAPALIPRTVPEDKMWLDPLEPKTPPADPTPLAPPPPAPSKAPAPAAPVSPVQSQGTPHRPQASLAPKPLPEPLLIPPVTETQPDSSPDHI